MSVCGGKPWVGTDGAVASYRVKGASKLAHSKAELRFLLAGRVPLA